jgi:DNA-binding beta-propeller fold protein YncE
LRLLLAGCAALFVLPWASFAGDISYVVLQRYPDVRLVRVSGDGQSLTTLAKGLRGTGLAVDKNGEYIVATVSSLVRVSASGVVKKIASCPNGLQWIFVTVDPDGNYIAVDNRQHSVWRVSHDGQTMQWVANYPVSNPLEMESVGLIVDASGDYLLAEDNVTGNFWRIAPSGRVIAIPLTGDRMRSADSIVEDGAGAYLVGSARDRAIFRVTSTGQATRFANVDGQNLSGLVRDPDTGALVAAVKFEPRLRKITANGSSVTEFSGVGYASAIVAEVGR